MAGANSPFITGKDVTLKIYSDGKPIYIAAKNWSVEQNATEIADGVCGEQRDRLDLLTNYFSASIDIYLSDEEVMQSLMDQQDNDDVSATPFLQSASIRIKHRNGTKAAYRLKDVKFGPWSTSVSGRTERNMLTLKLRFRYYESVQAI